jgi:hypothetical protein
MTACQRACYHGTRPRTNTIYNIVIIELIDIPTGLGKTDAVVLAWLWRRRFAGSQVRDTTPWGRFRLMLESVANISQQLNKQANFESEI